MIVVAYCLCKKQLTLFELVVSVLGKPVAVPRGVRPRGPLPKLPFTIITQQQEVEGFVCEDHGGVILPCSHRNLAKTLRCQTVTVERPPQHASLATHLCDLLF